MAIILITAIFPTIKGKEEGIPPVIENDSLKYTISFSKPNFKEIEIEGKTFTQINMFDCICIGEKEGMPSLPVHATKILLPYGKVIENITVYGNAIQLENLKEKPIIPYQKPIPINLLDKKQKFIFDQKLYDSIDEIPKKLYEYNGIGYCRGYAILTLNLYPIKYKPAEGKIFYYSNITIEIKLKYTGYVNRFFRNHPDDREWVRKLVINPEVADTYIAKTRDEYPGGICDPSEHYDYVIITRESLANFQATYNWSDLIERKEAEGLDATLVTVEEIEACPDYWNTTPLFNDTAAKIREFCRDAYMDWETQYILIGGDDDGPAAISRREMDYAYESNVDSDLYWSNLDDTFNDDMDNDWGEEGDSGFDLYSELFIGSIPCDEGIDVSNWLTKSFYYADSLEKDYLDNIASYAGDTGWLCEGDDFMDFTLWGTDNWLGPDPDSDGPWPSWLGFLYGYDTWNEENPGIEFNTSELHTSEPPNEGWMGDGVGGMKNAINSDLCTIIWGVAHANAHMSLDVYDTTWEAEYHNTKPFFLHDYGCHCGDMDAADDGVLHSMLFHDDTELAFACVYNTGYGWGNYYSTNSSSALQQKLFVDYMLNTSKSGGPMNWQLGRIQAYTKDALAPTINWDPSYGTWRGIIEGCLLFGDPAQTLKPPELPEHNVGIKRLEVEDHVEPGQTVYVNATIVNNGKNNETNVIVSFRVNGTEIDSTTIPFFESQTFEEVSFTWTPSKGWYIVTINVTIPGVEENITYDNEKSKIVVAGPDVAVSSIESPLYGVVNTTTKIKANICNLGKKDEIVDVSLIVNNTIMDTITVLIKAKKTEEITLLWSPEYEGTYPIAIRADVIGEAYKGNNERSMDINVVFAKGFILLVDDDVGDNYETYFENAIISAGYVYEYWDRMQGCPSPSYMASHTAVVWFTGDDYSTTLTSVDTDALSEYLDNGGRLFITGQDIGYDIHNDPFYTNYLHADYQVDDTNIYTLNGIEGDPIGDNLTIYIATGDGANNQNWPSGIYPILNATSVFKYEDSPYYGGIKYNGTYRVVYFSFGFEAINDMYDRTTVMQRILDWLGGGEEIHPPDISITPLNLNYLAAPGQQIFDTLSIANYGETNLSFEISFPHGFTLQWTHSHGGNGHSELAQPVGDIDEDGINEFLMGGYGSGGTYIYSYDPLQETYVQEYFWTYSGGWYNVPSGACVVDLDDDGDLEFVVSWEYSGEDGIHAYDWDGNNLTELDWYTGIGYDFAYDVYACDYDDDGDVEVLIANDPPSSSGYHVTALAWNNTSNKFEPEISWGSGEATECPMVWSGDTDGDGKTEVIACAGVDTVYALNYENGEWVADVIADNLPAHPYGVACGDLDEDGIDEIGIGLDSTDAYIFKWNGNEYEQVWHHNYAGEEDIIEGIGIGDADNDGQLEFLIGPENIHIVRWNGTGYEEVYLITETQGMLSSVIAADFDTDGENEVKACDILSGIGKEWIFEYIPEPQWINITPRNGTVLPNESIDLSMSIDTSQLDIGLNKYCIIVNSNDPDEARIELPLYLSIGYFATANISLLPGWNLITIPVGSCYTAKTLGSMIPYCTIISKWNSSIQQYQSYLVGISPDEFDFAIEDGVGYFVYVTNASIFTIAGREIETVSVPLHIGWNLIGWFRNETTASSLAENISGCNIVAKWNASSQQFEAYIARVSPKQFDFVIEQGMGIFIWVNEESIWHGEG